MKNLSEYKYEFSIHELKNKTSYTLKIFKQFLETTWSVNCVTINSAGAGIFAITGRNLYISIIILTTQDYTKLLQLVEKGYTERINWIRYLSKSESKSDLNKCLV